MANFFKKLWINIKENFTTKRFGFYVGLAAFILMIALLIGALITLIIIKRERNNAD